MAITNCYIIMNRTYLTPNKYAHNINSSINACSFAPIRRQDYHLLLSDSSRSHNSIETNEEHSNSSNFSTPSRRSNLQTSFNSSNFQQSLYLSSAKISAKNQLSHSSNINCRRLKKHAYIQQNECAICLSLIQKKAILPCTHYYCVTCIQEWIKNSTTCPYCRKQFTSYTHNGQIYRAEKKQFEYEPSNNEVLDWLCYRCDLTNQGDVILICDRCEAYACHIDCDQTLNGTEPEGDWYCHNCRE